MYTFIKPDILKLSVLLSMLLIASQSNAYQPDAPFQKAMQENAEAWQQENRAIDEKLAQLEQRFGKKPNIIYVLGDDVGWGELGSYLGGKLRGTPTPNLDGLAQQGMQFLSHYAEPSCHAYAAGVADRASSGADWRGYCALARTDARTGAGGIDGRRDAVCGRLSYRDVWQVACGRPGAARSGEPGL